MRDGANGDGFDGEDVEEGFEDDVEAMGSEGFNVREEEEELEADGLSDG